MMDDDVSESCSTLCVVLVRTEGALNLGSVARLCDNYGVDLRLVDPQVSPHHEEATMMAFPSEGRLRDVAQFATLADALVDADCVIGTSSKLGEALEQPTLCPEVARQIMGGYPGRVMLVFGNERLGLTRDEGARCHRVLRLETGGPRPSMNLSHAVAATLQVFALARKAETPSMAQGDAARASGASEELLLATWLSALTEAQYFRSQTPEGFARRLRALIQRMELSEHDVKLLQGMMKQLSHSGASTP